MASPHPTATAVLDSVAEAQLRLNVVTDRAGFDALEPVWDRVVAGARMAHPFLEYCWARTWWECFGAGSRLHILVVWRGEEPVAIAPMMVSTVRMMGVPLRRMGLLYNAHVPRAGFLVAEESEAVYRTIWRHLTHCGGWDVLQLSQLPEGSLDLECMARMAAEGEFSSGMWASGESPYIALDGCWDSYLAGLSSKHRTNLRNRRKRISLLGELRAESVTGGSELENALEDGFRIEAAAWKGAKGTAIACSPELRRFYGRFAERAAERGWLRLNFLRVGERRVAFDYSLRYKGRVFLLKLGYEPELSVYSPSGLLLSMVLEDAFRTGIARYEFLGDFMDWKRNWARESTAHRWLYIFSRGSARARAAHLLKFRMLPLVKRLARRG